MLVPESDNRIWGASLNPWSVDRTPGGSSGGEGALVGGRCSPLGLGSDIGGSIRIPGHFCGVPSFKPSSYRVTRGGLVAPRHKCSVQKQIPSIPGPLGRSVRDLALFFRVMLSDQVFSHDVGLPPVPFREELFAPGPPKAPRTRRSLAPPRRKLRVGHYTSMDFFEAAPGCQRAVREAVAALGRSDEVELVPWEPPQAVMTELVVMFIQLNSSEGTVGGQPRGWTDGMAGEPPIPQYSLMAALANIPRAVRPLLGAALHLLGEQRAAYITAGTFRRSTAEYWDLCGRIDAKVAEFNAAWQAAGLDACLSPAVGLPALKHGEAKYLSIGPCAYAYLYNVLGYAAGTVPLVTVGEEEEAYDPGAAGWDMMSKRAQASLRGSAGLPCSVQVAAPNFRDEVALRVMALVEEHAPRLDLPM
mmetsp:Transcript_14947/g.42538  ORF Transcript_14947/g.42538 Transcript_14947/m.42538 type:complete len:416 (+) Transcript_14947:147-1394(+)